jgi:hypothetical protein
MPERLSERLRDEGWIWDAAEIIKPGLGNEPRPLAECSRNAYLHEMEVHDVQTPLIAK